MPDTTVGFTMAEYAEYLQLTDLHSFYANMIFQDVGDLINFGKAMNDTIRRWQFITAWTRRQFDQSVSTMKSRIESPRITEIMMLDEPLCFEDIVCNKTKDRCAGCPLWHITGHPCEHTMGLKYKVTHSWKQGEGRFYPAIFAELLRKIKAGKPIYEADFEIFTGV